MQEINSKTPLPSENKMNEVIVLFDGYSKYLTDEKMDANCTCTLIKGQKNIIVDTMTAWDKDRIIEALLNHNITVDDIDYVICTHGHADHIGNNNLFTNATHIVGSCIHKQTIFEEIQTKNVSFEEGYQICPGVVVVRTPGHTEDSVSVLVKGVKNTFKLEVCYAITGDLFEKVEDIETPAIWQVVGSCHFVALQTENRWKISEIADYIIPGHGPMFEVTDKIRNTLKLDWTSHSVKK